jgi:hypothetical protein
VIRPIVHLVLLAILLTFVLSIDIVVIVISTITIAVCILGSRFIVDLRKGELGFVIYKGLEGLEDCHIIRCLASVHQVEI